MKWKEYVLLAGCLALSSLTQSISQVQPQRRFTPTPAQGTAVVEGTVQDASTKRPVAGASIRVKNQQGAIRAQQVTGADGKFQLQVDQNQTYTLITQASEYDLKEELLSFTSSSTNRLYGKVIRLYQTGTTPVSQPVQASTAAATSTEVNLLSATVTAQPSSSSATVASNARVTPPKTLDAKVVYTPPLVVAPVGKTTQLKAIQFVQSKSELLPDAMPALEQLLAFMQSKPTIEIELSGHTDNQGDFDENLRLSKQRVEVVKAYLARNGIDANRITTRGYGPTRPIASNNAENTRQQNRRVEMIVVKQ